MGIKLRGADARMAEHLLDDAQVRAVLEQMCGETMPEHMRGDVLADAALFHAIFNVQPHRGCGESCAAPGEEHVSGRFGFYQARSAHFQVAIQTLDRGSTDRHDSLLVSLSNHIDKPS